MSQPTQVTQLPARAQVVIPQLPGRAQVVIPQLPGRAQVVIPQLPTRAPVVPQLPTRAPIVPQLPTRAPIVPQLSTRAPVVPQLPPVVISQNTNQQPIGYKPLTLVIYRRDEADNILNIPVTNHVNIERSPDIYGLDIDIDEMVDIFDFTKYAEEYNMIRNLFSGLELFLRASLIIDYKYNYLSEKDRNILTLSLNGKEDPLIKKKFIKEITNVLEPAYIMLQWYRHFALDKLQSDPGVVARVLDKYQGNEDIAFNQMYRKRVDPNYRYTPLWFTVSHSWYESNK